MVDYKRKDCIMKITFKPTGNTCELDNGRTLMEASAAAGVHIDANCNSIGICGKCKVRILEGEGNDITPEERNLLTDSELRSGYRLACKYIPETDIVAETIPVGSSVHRKASLMKLPDFWDEEPFPFKTYIEIPENSLEDQTSEFDKIKRELGNVELLADRKIIRKVQHIVKECRDITVTIVNDEIVNVEPGDTTEKCYGMAFDIGTTTVVGILWNLCTWEMVGTMAETNPQGAFGADVISRITFIDGDNEKLHILHEKIIASMNNITAEICRETGVDKDDIYRCSVVGNTTMSHIFAEIHPQSLALAPYIPTFCSPIQEKAADLNIDMNENGNVYLMANIAGHVGSDITAGLLATNIMEEERNHLLIDIGTNGEIVLAGNGKAFTCSTAAGPAFEGASITKGMRAASGAIEKVVIKDGKVEIKTIDDAKPIGICGSGIIDAVGQLVKTGILEKSGRFCKPEKMIEEGYPEDYVSRLRKTGRTWEFVLYYDEDENDVTITQKDIREVQLAKAAMFTGMEVLLEQMGITAKELDQISIAGAFGSYISIENALNIGLLPDIDKGRIRAIGNAAGVGASMSVLSDKARSNSARYAREIKHVELAALSDFQEKYIGAMEF